MIATPLRILKICGHIAGSLNALPHDGVAPMACRVAAAIGADDQHQGEA
jgi:hypothetical protein